MLCVTVGLQNYVCKKLRNIRRYLHLKYIYYYLHYFPCTVIDVLFEDVQYYTIWMKN